MHFLQYSLNWHGRVQKSLISLNTGHKCAVHDIWNRLINTHTQYSICICSYTMACHTKCHISSCVYECECVCVLVCVYVCLCAAYYLLNRKKKIRS